MPYLTDNGLSPVCQIWHNIKEVPVARPRVHRSKMYKDWYKTLNSKDQGIVDTRVDTYCEKGLLLKSKLLDSDYGLYEFKWDSGLRVYFSFIEDSEGRLMLLLLGGNKNSQQRDITEAKNIVTKAVIKISAKKKTSRKVAGTRRKK